jgi:hypothetical protein
MLEHFFAGQGNFHIYLCIDVPGIMVLKQKSLKISLIKGTLYDCIEGKLKIIVLIAEILVSYVVMQDGL